MALNVIMPRQGQSVESCIITKWHKHPGETVAVGDILFAYETDKAAFEESAKVSGTLLAAFFQEGDDVPCLTNVCVIGNPGEDFSQFDPKGGAPGAEAPAKAAEAAVAAPQAAVAATSAPVDGDLKISPRARALAESRFADLSKVSASGPDGRVIARDVQALLDAGVVVTPAASASYAGGAAGTGLGGRVSLKDLETPAPAAAPASKAEAPAAALPAPEAAYVDEPLTNMRKVIAKAMIQSLSSMAQLTHTLTFDCTQIQNLRKVYKEHGEALGLNGVSLGDMVMFAVARTLAKPEHRALNANLIDGTTMRYFKGVNLGFACDTERGLMVPVIYGADKMSLLQISNATKELAKACRAGTINPDLLKGGSFTVSNLGALGIESFTPIINPPQTGILGVDAIIPRVREVNGKVEVFQAMGLSLTYDHRAIDGMPASKFLADLKNGLENFLLLLAKG
jgi:pyruvate dehydrogenase E2 component (dihydrolipoamide acetyltransferase)